MNSLLSSVHQVLTQKELGYQTKICSLLDNYVEEKHTDWQRYQLFAPCKYARNLVEINDEFEAIVLCWDSNQESPIHNHTLQNCWFVVLTGCIEEIQYSIDNSTGKLRESGCTVLRDGQVGYIHDDIAVHKIRSINDQACTLHIYNKPIPFCNIIDPNTGECMVRKSGFFSVKGKKQDPEMTAMYQDIYRRIEEKLEEDEMERLRQIHQAGSLYSSEPGSILSTVTEGNSGKEEFSAW